MAVAAQVIQAMGPVQKGLAAEQAGEYNARIAERNGIIAEANAKEAAERERRSARRRLGAARAATGASGITLSGSALEALADSAAEAELDALTIEYEGKLKKMGYQSEAVAERMGGKSAADAGYLAAASSILGSQARK